MHSALQSVHVVDPLVLEKVRPSTHCVHADLPLDDADVPTGHGAQKELPFMDANDPAAHSRHCVMPCLSAYSPGRQGVHCSAAVALEAVPVSHRMQAEDPVSAA